MTKNAVVSIVIKESKEWEAGKQSVLNYCKKYDLHLEVITQTKYGIEPFDKFSNSINLFEKNQVYDLFEQYDRILRLDFDLLITPTCPNLFELVPEHQIGGVYEDIGIAKEDRLNRIRIIQDHLGNLDWSSGYLNAGVIVASREHKEIFNTTLEEIQRAQAIPEINTPEQDYLNYMIRKLGFEVFSLDHRFNHIVHFPNDRFSSYIIHYAGSNVFDEDLQIRKNGNMDKKLWRELTAQQMKRDWEYLINNNLKILEVK